MFRARTAVVVLGLLTLAVIASAQTEKVTTNASVQATYSSISQNGGPYPWSDLGVTGSAVLSPGTLQALVGGQTSFDLPTNAVTGNELFTPGTTSLDLGYTPTWSGAIATSASGTLESDFVYHIGPFNGSNTLLQVPLSTATSANNLGGSLMSNTGNSITSVGPGPGVEMSGNLNAQVGICPFCTTLASFSMDLNVGSQIQQTVNWSPTVTYGDLEWYSTTQTYSPSDHPVFVTGSGGQVQNVFQTPAGLSLANGDTFYFNLLPAVFLNMQVGDSADITIPATLSFSGQVFGVDLGSGNFGPSNLYDLGTGSEAFNFNAAWYGSQFYSVPLQYTETCPGSLCFATYETPNSSGGIVQFAGNGAPSDMPPINFTGGPWPGQSGGPGISNLGPLFPDGNCAPADTPDAGQCITQVSVTTTPTPEPSGLLLLGTGVLGLALQLRRRPQRRLTTA